MSNETSYPTANAKRFTLDVDLDADCLLTATSSTLTDWTTSP